MTFAIATVSGKVLEVQSTGEKTGSVMLELEKGNRIMLELYGQQVDKFKGFQDKLVLVTGKAFIEGSLLVISNISNSVLTNELMSNVTVCGYAGRPAEAKEVKSGLQVANTSLAVNTYGKEKASWFNITFFRKQADIADRFVDKGTMLAVTGRLQFDSYKNKEGVEVKKITIICGELNLMPKSMKRGGDSANSSTSTSQVSSQPATNLTDDIPF